jgi:hypothetical protein
MAEEDRGIMLPGESDARRRARAAHQQVAQFAAIGAGGFADAPDIGREALCRREALCPCMVWPPVTPRS